jgi:SAM-dependent methyltransferase
MDASQMQFEDHTFDVCYCIAVLEHVKNPLVVLQEIKRVMRRGGYGYIQAGPLYFSPFGHHMFGYFDDYPWIHLRLSKAQIAAYAKERDIDQPISQATGMSVETYLDGIFNIDHLNGRRLQDYHLDQFMSDPDVEKVSFIRSFEGENLLTPAIRQELSGYSEGDLITHGFELVFRVK